MAASKAYLSFILDQLSDLDGITYRAMMGEYILYYRGRICAYLCDDRLFIKPVPAARALLPDAPMEPPYPGAKEMLLAENVDDRDALQVLLNAIYPELSEPKPKRRRP